MTTLSARPFLAALAIAVAAVATPAGAAPPAKGAHMMAHDGMTAAHDMSIRLSIANGAVLAKGPTSVRFDFVPAMRLRSVVLSNAAGERIPVTFDAKTKAGSVVVTFATLDPDVYTLAFSADAGDHDMPGKIRFTVR